MPMYLGDIWHIAIRLVRALIFNPPSLPGWATWFTLIIRTVVVLVIFRRNIAPFLLVKVIPRIRARSISILSIRGLYFRNGRRTWRAERIGWSFHPWAESRLSVKVEGLRVDIDKPERFVRRRKANRPQSLVQKSMAVWAAFHETVAFSTLWFLKWILKSPPLTWVQNTSSSAIIVAARLLIHCLPSLTQNVDLELDSAVISFEALSGAHFIIKGATLRTKVDFSQLDKDVKGSNSGIGKGRATSQPWNPFIKGSAGRFWEHVWGQTEVSALIDVTVREMAGYSRPPTSITPRHSKLLTSRSSDADSVADRQVNSGTFIRMATPVHFSSSFQFNPKLLVLQHHSVDVSLVIPTIEISADGVRLLMEMNEEEDDSDQEEVMTPLMSRAPWSASVVSSGSPPGSPLVSPTSSTSPLMTAFHIVRAVITQVNYSNMEYRPESVSPSLFHHRPHHLFSVSERLKRRYTWSRHLCLPLSLTSSPAFHRSDEVHQNTIPID